MRAGEALSARAELVIPADIRFPLERANGVQIVKTADALARAGVRTTLLVRRSDPRPDAELLALYGLTPRLELRIRRLVRHRPGLRHGTRLAFLLRAAFACGRALARGAAVLTRDLQLAELLLRLSPSSRRRLVYEAHAVEALMYRERGALYGTGERPSRRKEARLDRRERRVWRRAAGVVTTTAGIRDSFLERHGPRGPARVIPNGCDIPVSRNFPGLAVVDPPRILYAGQLYPWKGVDVLVAAAATLPGARLVILGGLAGERDLERVRARVRECGIEDRCELQGSVPQAQVAAELARASVVAVPFLRSLMTERHTSPLKAFEAMAAGRPIVASDLPSSREVLEDGRDALLVAPGDAPALGAALGRVLRDPGLAERLARGAWARAPRYSWDARARALVGLFEELA
jgi:glycosyltransferase involved in cell wall biosynthesis